jgi:hypothetical protein
VGAVGPAVTDGCTVGSPEGWLEGLRLGWSEG